MPHDEPRDQAPATEQSPSDLKSFPSRESEPVAVADNRPTPPPIAPVADTSQTPQQPNTPGILILQWLTYAFWGWFALAIGWLTAVVCAFFISGSASDDWSSIIAYPIAAVVVLLLIAGVCDLFYSRSEPVRKHGAASVILIIHMVLFSLFGIGSLICVVFASVSYVISVGKSGKEAILIALLTGLLMVVVYSLLVARTYFARKLGRRGVIFAGSLIGISVILIAAAVFGPFAQAAITRQDRLIDAALPTISRTINQSVNKNKELPKDLTSLTFDSPSGESDVREVIEKGLVRYKPNTKPASSTDAQYSTVTNSKTYYYQLCTTYQQEKKSSYAYDSFQSLTTDYRNDLYSIGSHPKGEACYKLKTSSYDTTNPDIRPSY